MRLRLLPTNEPAPTDATRVSIDLRASGILKAIAHSPTLTASPRSATAEFTPAAGGAEGQGAVEATFDADAVEAPADIPASDRRQMLDNVRGPDVLAAARFPAIAFQGRYRGTLERGTLDGEIHLRGSARRVSLPIRATREGNTLVATGTWEGRLTDLGIKPFRALLGAIKLEDWIRLRLEVRLAIDES